MSMQNLLPGAAPTLLPAEPHDAVAGDVAAGATPAQAAAAHPAASLGWALLAAQAWDQDSVIESYAFARVGYHRGLDALRRAGWRGAGPVPWSHAPNRGFLMSLHALGRAAGHIGEDDEATRCREFLDACDPQAAAALAG